MPSQQPRGVPSQIFLDWKESQLEAELFGCPVDNAGHASPAFGVAASGSGETRADLLTTRVESATRWADVRLMLEATQMGPSKMGGPQLTALLSHLARLSRPTRAAPPSGAGGTLVRMSEAERREVRAWADGCVRTRAGHKQSTITPGQFR